VKFHENFLKPVQNVPVLPQPTGCKPHCRHGVFIIASTTKWPQIAPAAGRARSVAIYFHGNADSNVCVTKL